MGLIFDNTNVITNLVQVKVIGFVKFLWGLRGVVLTSSGKDIPCKKKINRLPEVTEYVS